ncbi:MAG: hypothetical protein ACLQNE_22045 [Thermoguttaceae bacterium]
MAEDDTDQGQRKESVSDYELKQRAADEDGLGQPDDVLKQPSPAVYDLKQPAPAEPKPVPPKDVPPPIPPNDFRPDLPKGDDVSVKGIAASFAHHCEVAFQILRKRLERDKLNWWVLPHAYRALGEHVYGEGAYRADFPNAYVRLDGLRAEIALLQNQPFIERLALPFLKGRATNAFRELGQGAFEKIGDQTEATLPIRDALACIEKLSAEIAELSQAQPGQIVTPNRILVVGGVVILVLLLFLAKWLFFGGQPDQTSKP